MADSQTTSDYDGVTGAEWEEYEKGNRNPWPRAATDIERLRLFLATCALWACTRIMPSNCQARIERKI